VLCLVEIENDLMPTIRVEAEISREELLKAVEQLSPQELEQFIAQVLSLRARREAPGLSATDSQLLFRINRGLPEDLGRRYAELIAKRQSENLDQNELAELRQLTNVVESFEADRVSALSDLAHSRGISLETLMIDLGIPAPIHE
jgi:hypothetical protein